ncbi:MAG: GAF domain-containing sensor histidine kinase [Anaerolineae bacterium]|nr:GAF domain-containing sensor histidine kinase [Anaerolineae bacterium]
MSESETVEQLQAILAQLREENEQLQQGYTELSNRLIALGLLHHIAQELVTELDLDKLLQRTLRAAISAVQGQAGALLLLDPMCQELVFSVVEGGGGEALRGRRMAADNGLAGWAVTHNEPIIVPDVQKDKRFFAQISADVHFQVESLMCVPLATRERVIGAIQVLNRALGMHFGEEDLNVLASFAAQSAAAIDNARLYQEVKRERDRILALEEDVRRRLARDLHDGPAQLLASAVLNIEFIHMLWDREPAKVPEELDKLVPLIQKALRQVRTLLFDLRPVILETQGLVAALQMYVEQQRGMDSDLAYHLEVHGVCGRFEPAVERAIFSIVQEAVGNARKYAHAQNIWIALVARGGMLLVAVRDDGRGFDAAAVDADYGHRGSLGMVNMRERAAVVGGQLSIHSRPGQGTTISLTAPLTKLTAA